MSFQALDFAVSCTVAKYEVYVLLLYNEQELSRRTYLVPVLVFIISALLLLLAPTVEACATELRFFSRCPRRHLVRAGSYCVLGYSSGRAHYTLTVAAELRIIKKKTGTYELLLVLQQ